MKFEDMAEFELKIQLDRLKYVDAVLQKRTFCDFPPRKVYIEPTNMCNLKCVHCVHNGAMTRKPSFLDVDLYKQRIDEIKHLRLHSKIQFTGVGEPLLHKKIFDIIRHASDLGFFTLMNSNATLITPQKAEMLVDSGLDYLHVSIDGVTRKTYESIRVGAKLKTVIENLFHLFEARHKNNGYHLAVVLGLIDQSRNHGEIKDFQDFFGQFPFHHIVTGELFNHMGAIEEANAAHAEKKGRAHETYPVCNTPWDLLSFNCDGKAIGCNYDFDNRFVIGDMREQSILDIWNSEKMRMFRQSLYDRNYEAIEENGPLCSECTIKWMEDYHLPRDFYSEVAGMEEYLTRAVRRCSTHRERNAEFREKEKVFLNGHDRIMNQFHRMNA